MNEIILGGIIGFLAATGKDLIVKLLDQKREKALLYKSKLEEIFILTDTLHNKVLKLPAFLLDNNQKANHTIDETGSKLAMIIQLYFPHIEQNYQDYLKINFDTAFFLIQYSTDQEFKNKTDETIYLNIMNSYQEKYLLFKQTLQDTAQMYK